MPGGSLHWPLWVPYELYGRVDHVYGFKAWNAGLGFTGAQGMMNLVESALYAIYWGLWYRNKDAAGEVSGRAGGLAVAVGFAASVMTFSKTVLYCEYLPILGRRGERGMNMGNRLTRHRAERVLLGLR
jgi:hypothetical protein